VRTGRSSDRRTSRNEGGAVSPTYADRERRASILDPGRPPRPTASLTANRFRLLTRIEPKCRPRGGACSGFRLPTGAKPLPRISTASGRRTVAITSSALALGAPVGFRRCRIRAPRGGRAQADVRVGRHEPTVQANCPRIAAPSYAAFPLAVTAAARYSTAKTFAWRSERLLGWSRDDRQVPVDRARGLAAPSWCRGGGSLGRPRRRGSHAGAGRGSAVRSRFRSDRRSAPSRTEPSATDGAARSRPMPFPPLDTGRPTRYPEDIR
jgi:hypothetical protein